MFAILCHLFCHVIGEVETLWSGRLSVSHLIDNVNKRPDRGTFLTRQTLRGLLSMKKCILDKNCSLSKAGRLSMSLHATICVTECFVNRASSDGTKMQSFSSDDHGREKMCIFD